MIYLVYLVSLIIANEMVIMQQPKGYGPNIGNHPSETQETNTNND